MKTHKYNLAASLICGNFLNLVEDLKELEKGQIDYIHFDVMDGVFVPRYGLFPEIITQIRSISDIPIDVHMMVDDAEKYIDTFVNAGLNKKEDVFVIHAETTQHLDRVLRRVHDKGIKAGVALNPSTPLSIFDYVLNELDLIMLMAINPGIVGHKLIPSILDKIIDVKTITKDHPNIIIEVDGGVNFDSAPSMIKNGADMLVCGTQTIYRGEKELSYNIHKLRQKLDRV